MLDLSVITVCAHPPNLQISLCVHVVSVATLKYQTRMHLDCIPELASMLDGLADFVSHILGIDHIAIRVIVSSVAALIDIDLNAIDYTTVRRAIVPPVEPTPFHRRKAASLSSGVTIAKSSSVT